MKHTLQKWYVLLLLITNLVGVETAAQSNCGVSTIPINKFIGKKDFLIIRTNFVGGNVDKYTFKNRIDGYMAAVDGYLKKVSNNKVRVGNYQITPIFTSSLTSTDIKDNWDGIVEEMNRLASNSGFDVKNKLVYYIFDATSVQLSGGGAFGRGNGISGQTWWPARLPYVAGGFVHETMHMLGIGHLGLIVGDRSYPGQRELNGLDPFNFMGTEGALTTWNPNKPSEGIDAPLPLSIKRKLGWISSKNLVTLNALQSVKQRIYISDTQGYSDTRKLGIVLNNFTDTQSFVIGYHMNLEKSGRIKEGGILVHEFQPHDASKTFLLDAHPNSVDGVPDDTRSGPLWEMVYEFTDAALQQGEEMNVADRFLIKVLAQGGSGNDRWADVEIIIKEGFCDASKIRLTHDDFEYSNLISGSKCSNPGFSHKWNLDTKRKNQIQLNSSSLTYKTLVTQGKSISIRGVENKPSFVVNATLKEAYCPGDTMWLSFLMRADQLSNGHVFVYPNSSIHGAVGKSYGRNFAINNINSNQQMQSNLTTLVVAKYVVKNGNDDMYLWINPDTAQEPSVRSALVKSVGRHDIGNQLSTLTINVSGNGNGQYSFDRIRTAPSYNTLFDTNVSPSPFVEEAPIGKWIWLRKTGGDRKYVSAIRFGRKLVAQGDKISWWEKFLVEKHPKGGIALRAQSDGKFVQVPDKDENAAVRNSGTFKGDWEQLEWKSKGPGKVAFRSIHSGKWLQASYFENDALIRARGKQDLTWETFEYAVVEPGGKQLETDNLPTAIRVFPNPAIDYITVSNTLENEPLMIYSLSGAKVTFPKVIYDDTSGRVDISALSVGIYFVRTTTGEIVRFVKE